MTAIPVAVETITANATAMSEVDIHAEIPSVKPAMDGSGATVHLREGTTLETSPSAP